MTQQASTDGQIGGNAVVHLSLPLPPAATPATVISVVIHENAAPDTSHDITATNVSLFDSASPCAIPRPACPPAGSPIMRTSPGLWAGATALTRSRRQANSPAPEPRSRRRRPCATTRRRRRRPSSDAALSPLAIRRVFLYNRGRKQEQETKGCVSDFGRGKTHDFRT